MSRTAPKRGTDAEALSSASRSRLAGITRLTTSRAGTEAFLGDAGGPVTGVRAHRMRLGVPDSSGRQSPEPVPDSSFVIDADLVVKALGFDPEDLPHMFGEPALTVTRWGTIKAAFGTGMTDLPGVFAAGDIVRGASLVVWAIRDGRDAADAMHKYIQQRSTANTSVAAE